jgi:3-oxoacyl-[acyl-carrier-protein] synthase-1
LLKQIFFNEVRNKLKRVVITGIGIVSSIGNNYAEVKESLFNAKSGITFQPEYAERGLDQM